MTPEVQIGAIVVLLLILGMYAYSFLRGGPGRFEWLARTPADLQACPWCGSAAFLHGNAENSFFASCGNTGCTLIGPTASDRQGAVAAWNSIEVRRAPVGVVLGRRH
jgi:hypothetical protein